MIKKNTIISVHFLTECWCHDHLKQPQKLIKDKAIGVCESYAKFSKILILKFL